MAIITQDYENEQLVSARIKNFFQRCQIGDVLKRCNAYKRSGIPAVAVVMYYFCLVFRNRTMFLDMKSDRKSCIFGQDVVYRLMNAVYINWLRFTTMIAARIISNTVQPLTTDRNRDVFIIDDTIYERARSKKVELLAWVHDHTKHKSVRGFQLLTLGWSDGVTFIPVNSQLMSTKNDEKRINEAKSVPVNSAAAKRRKMAQMEKPDVVPMLLNEAKDAGITAKYVLFDSWYCTSKVVQSVLDLDLHVVAMVKRGNKKYVYNEQRLDCRELFALSRKRRGCSRYLLSLDVKMPYTPEGSKEETLIPVRLVYVRNRNKRNEYLVLLTTDLSLTAEDVIQIYGKRWDIEVFFKTCKSVLKLTDECRSVSYDAMCAHSAIVFARYMMLAVEARNEKDPRTAGPLFCLISDEIADVTFQKAFAFLQQIWERLLSGLNLPEKQITALFQDLWENLPADIAALLGKWPVCRCLEAG